MARLIEFLCFLFILYMFYRRIASPFRRGFDARDRERREFQQFRNQQFHQAQRTEQFVQDRQPTRQAASQKIDRGPIEDAEFEDLD